MAGYMRGISQPLSDKRQSIANFSSSDQQKSRTKNNTSLENEYVLNNHNYGSKLKNIKAARTYVFGDNNDDDDDKVDVVYEMRSRHKKPPGFVLEQAPAPDYFEKEISEGETLQAIALKYACQVSEIKRINNLIQDQEFYGLKVIKVPMTRYGILSEQFANRNLTVKPSRSVTNILNSSLDNEEVYIRDFEETGSQHDFSDPDTQIKILRTLSIRDNFSARDREAEKFLLKMDDDLQKFKQSSGRPKNSLTEVISVLNNKSIQPLQTVKKHNGADCGISWWSILIASLVIAIVVPLVVLLYYLLFYHHPH